MFQIKAAILTAPTPFLFSCLLDNFTLTATKLWCFHENLPLAINIPQCSWYPLDNSWLPSYFITPCWRSCSVLTLSTTGKLCTASKLNAKPKQHKSPCRGWPVLLFFQREASHKIHYIYKCFACSCKPVAFCSTDSSKLCNLGSAPWRESGEWRHSPTSHGSCGTSGRGESLKKGWRQKSFFWGWKFFLFSLQEETSQQQEAASAFPSGAHPPLLSRRQSLETQFLQHRLQVPCLPSAALSQTLLLHGSPALQLLLFSSRKKKKSVKGEISRTAEFEILLCLSFVRCWP